MICGAGRDADLGIGAGATYGSLARTIQTNCRFLHQLLDEVALHYEGVEVLNVRWKVGPHCLLHVQRDIGQGVDQIQWDLSVIVHVFDDPLKDVGQ